jgi:hypothetical protein
MLLFPINIKFHNKGKIGISGIELSLTGGMIPEFLALSFYIKKL